MSHLGCLRLSVESVFAGNYDQMQQPKNISDQARKHVCFFMFVDEETAHAISDDGTIPNKIGLWRVVMVQNLPYTDDRRNGKVCLLILLALCDNKSTFVSPPQMQQ